MSDSNHDSLAAPLLPPLRVFTCKAFLDEVGASTVPHFLESIIPSVGIVLLVAPPLVGKTLLLLGIFAAWSARVGKFAGLTFGNGPRYSPILCELEHADAEVAKSIRATAAGVGEEQTNMVLIRPPLEMLDENAAERVRLLAEEHESPVVAFDSLRRLGPFDENNSNDIAQIGRLLSHVVDNTRAVIVVHHTNADGGRPRGSGDLLALADVAIFLHRSGERLVLDVRSHTAQDSRIEIRLVTIDKSDGHGAAIRFEAVAEARKVERDELKEAIANVLSAKPLTTDGIKGLLKGKVRFKNDALVKALEEMKTKGEVMDEAPAGARKHRWTRPAQLTAGKAATQDSDHPSRGSPPTASNNQIHTAVLSRGDQPVTPAGAPSGPPRRGNGTGPGHPEREGTTGNVGDTEGV